MPPRTQQLAGNIVSKEKYSSAKRSDAGKKVSYWSDEENFAANEYVESIICGAITLADAARLLMQQFPNRTQVACGNHLGRLVKARRQQNALRNSEGGKQEENKTPEFTRDS